MNSSMPTRAGARAHALSPARRDFDDFTSPTVSNDDEPYRCIEAAQVVGVTCDDWLLVTSGRHDDEGVNHVARSRCGGQKPNLTPICEALQSSRSPCSIEWRTHRRVVSHRAAESKASSSARCWLRPKSRIYRPLSVSGDELRESLALSRCHGDRLLKPFRPACSPTRDELLATSLRSKRMGDAPPTNPRYGPRPRGRSCEVIWSRNEAENEVDKAFVDPLLVSPRPESLDSG